MDCKEVLSKIDNYFEGTLTEIEVHLIKKHMSKCDDCRHEYEEMEGIFHLLSHHQVVVPPPDFTNQVMVFINKDIKIKRIKQKMISKLAASFIAAGVLISFLNLSSLDYNIADLTTDIYKGTTQVNEKVVGPFNSITKLLNNWGYGINQQDDLVE